MVPSEPGAGLLFHIHLLLISFRCMRQAALKSRFALPLASKNLYFVGKDRFDREAKA
jgi:hypothetical protein